VQDRVSATLRVALRVRVLGWLCELLVEGVGVRLALPLVPVEKLPEELRDRDRVQVGALGLGLGDGVKDAVREMVREAVGPESLREGWLRLGEALVGVNVRVPGDTVNEIVRCESDREPVV